MKKEKTIYRKNHPESTPHLIIDTIEHPAVWETANFLETQGFEITRLPVNHQGLVNPMTVKNAIQDNMYTNIHTYFLPRFY